MDKDRRGSSSPALGQIRRKDKRNYLRPQAKVEDTVCHGACQRGVGYEETAGKTHPTQAQKKERQAQMEPLQERVAEVIAQVEEAKTHIAQT
jgi:hypothetical protein